MKGVLKKLMKKQKIIPAVPVAVLVIIFIGLTSVTAYAEDMMYFYKLAVEQDPQLRGAMYKHQATGETLKQAWSHFLPTLNVEAEYTRTFQNIVSSDNTVYQKGSASFDSKNYLAQLTQPVIHYENFIGLKQAKSVVKRSDLEIELAGQDLILRVAESYLAVLSARENLAFVKAEEAAVELHFEDIQGRHKMGLVPVTDLYDAQARLAAVKADKSEAERVLDDALQALREVSGTAAGELSNLRDEAPLQNPDPDDIDKWLEAASLQNKGILISKLDADVANREVQLQKSGHYPVLDLLVKKNRQDTSGTLFGGGSVVDNTDISLKLTFPIFSGGLISSRTREAEAMYKKALQDLTKQERTVVRQVHDAFFGLKSTISRVDALKKSVEFQKIVLEAKQEGFKSGMFRSLAVLDAARDLYFYKKNFARARYDYLQNYLKLRHAAGTLNEQDMMTVNGWLN